MCEQFDWPCSMRFAMFLQSGKTFFITFCNALAIWDTQAIAFRMPEQCETQMPTRFAMLFAIWATVFIATIHQGPARGGAQALTYIGKARLVT